MLRRRHFISLTTAASAATVLPRGHPQTLSPERAILRATNIKLATMPDDFTGLSYEVVQLYNPDFF